MPRFGRSARREERVRWCARRGARGGARAVCERRLGRPRLARLESPARLRRSGPIFWCFERSSRSGFDGNSRRGRGRSSRRRCRRRCWRWRIERRPRPRRQVACDLSGGARRSALSHRSLRDRFRHGPSCGANKRIRAFCRHFVRRIQIALESFQVHIYQYSIYTAITQLFFQTMLFGHST